VKKGGHGRTFFKTRAGGGENLALKKNEKKRGAAKERAQGREGREGAASSKGAPSLLLSRAEKRGEQKKKKKKKKRTRKGVPKLKGASPGGKGRKGMDRAAWDVLLLKGYEGRGRKGRVGNMWKGKELMGWRELVLFESYWTEKGKPHKLFYKSRDEDRGGKIARGANQGWKLG